MIKKSFEDIEKRKLQSMKEQSEESRNSTHGYMEMGNDAEVHAKARAMRNNDNGSHL
jgi:hypothetical protein